MTSVPEDQQFPAESLVHNSLWFSLSELQQLVLKAARGAGYCWSDAEEIGWAAGWLSRYGLSGGELVLSLMQSDELQAPIPTPQRWSNSHLPYCPLRCGLALMDFAQLPEGLGRKSSLTIELMFGLTCFLPFAARTARQIQHPLQIEWEKQSLLIDANSQPSVGIDWVPMEFGKVVEVRISRSDLDMIPVQTKRPQHGVFVFPKMLEMLEAFSQQTLVPASELSRLRAGGRDDATS
jgi:hypothetical protein